MPGIEDIIETIAPFAFVLIWILSAVFGRTKEQPPAKTSRPVFGPSRERPAPARKPDQATVSTEPGAQVDWRDIEDENPYRQTTYDADQQAREEAARQKQRLAKALREREKREAAKAKRDAAAKRKAGDVSSQSHSVGSNKPINLSHLVSDHAAEAHLEHALTDRSPAAPSPVRRQSAMAAKIINGINDREAVRRAVIMSIVLGEPKSKEARSKNV